MGNSPMNREAFIRIIKALQEQKQREEKFSEAIQQAFVGAGELAEFHTASNFTPPTNVMVDQILEALSYGFVGKNQTQEEAYDHINYFFYELEMMNYVFMEPVSEDNQFEVQPVPAYYHSKDGTKRPLATPEDLYNSLVYEMTAERPVESKKTPVETPSETIDPMLDDPAFRAMYDRVIKVIDEHLGLTADDTKIHIAPTNDICNDFGMYSADSLDYVEILMALETEFGYTFSDDDFDEIKINPTPLAITKWIANKIGLNASQS